jgi:carboxypeptidase D
MLDQKDHTYYDLSGKSLILCRLDSLLLSLHAGALLYDPTIGQFDYVQEEVPIVPFLLEYAHLFNLNESFMAEMQSLHMSCGYQDYIDKYLVFPASGIQPQKHLNNTADASCDVFIMIFYAALNPNPCFSIYEVNSMCPILWDVLGFPTEVFDTPPGASVYFDRADVKAALHAPQNVTWVVCSKSSVFAGTGTGGPEGEGDLSANPIEHVLPRVIEATNRVLIANGDYDMVILTNGTMLAIQNMTWNGKLGFESRPSTPINAKIPDLVYASTFDSNGISGADGPQGVMGIQHYERGLLWAQTYQSGHMQPQFQPRVSYRHLEWLLGHTDQL